MAQKHITINDVSPRATFVADGVIKIYEFSFPVFSGADVKVYLDDSLQSSGFTVVVNKAPTVGGSVTFTIAPTADSAITLVRNLPIQRLSDFQESGEFRAKIINDELDYLTALVQQVDDDASRSIGLSPSDPDASLLLPVVSARLDKALVFDANGNVGVSAEAYSTILQRATDSEAAAASAETIEAAALASATAAGAAETAAAAAAAAAQVVVSQLDGEAIADDDGDTSWETERGTDDDTLRGKAGGTDVIEAGATEVKSLVPFDVTGTIVASGNITSSGVLSGASVSTAGSGTAG
ncbi:MAG: hypothetical protein HN578_03465, partial [Rhodospirillales bacterium]|nr:hypothetical protein [Rhodospirillales bacterium]